MQRSYGLRRDIIGCRLEVVKESFNGVWRRVTVGKTSYTRFSKM